MGREIAILIAARLSQLASENRIGVDKNLPNRARAGLLQTITLGPEAIASSALLWRKLWFTNAIVCNKLRS